MLKPSKIAMFSMLVACGGAEVARPGTADQIREPVGLHAADMQYRTCESKQPAGCEIAVLAGDPQSDGLFTVRVRAPGPFTVDPHSHPGVERITVIEGTVHVGLGDTLDKSQGRAYSAGDFYMNPAGAVHYLWGDGPAVLQITGHGPRAFVPAGATDSH